MTFRFNTSALAKAVRERLRESEALTEAAMNDVAHFLVGEARNRAPVDEGNLVNSISGAVQRNAKSSSAVVYVPSNSPAAQYAIPMHENVYNLGPNSKAKQSKVDVVVGRKYLTRAIEENRDRIVKIIEYRAKRNG